MSAKTFEMFEQRRFPLQAIDAILRVYRNKEATYEIYRIMGALDGPAVERHFQAFAASDTGRHVLAAKRDLKTLLDDRDRLASMPEGSVGRAYVDFVTREGLSAEAFQAEMDSSGEVFDKAGEDRKRYLHRIRHTHDIVHVMTGYGRDLVGELSQLAFTRPQNDSDAFLLIMIFGYFKCLQEYPGLPLRKCLAEGRRLGRQCKNLLHADWEALMPRPLEEVRDYLNVGVPSLYLSVKDRAAEVDRRYRERLATEPA
jgi:ubiquinone biosynthesis protein COQ4